MRHHSQSHHTLNVAQLDLLERAAGVYPDIVLLRNGGFYERDPSFLAGLQIHP